MRPIKFRAWDKVKKQMFNDVQDEYATDDFPEWTETGAFYFGDLLHDKDFFVEQYTGLKDNSDKEIYEGDIIKAEAENDDGSVDGMIGKVSYDNYTASFVFIPLDNYKEIRSFDNLFDEGFCELFYIGNVHENPELLEDK